MPMKVGTAKAIAKGWVTTNAEREPWFLGAYISGSTVDMPDDAELPAASDVDVVVVVKGDETPPKLGKVFHDGVLLEITHLPWSLYTPLEAVLANHHLATGLRTNTIISDPTGELSALQALIAQHFADPHWVRKRCCAVLDRIRNGLETIDHTAPLHTRVMSWVFPTGMSAHVPLVAALRNPTVRLRYPAARKALLDYGLSSLYPELLGLLGCSGMTGDQALHHLSGLAHTFDAAASVARTPFPYSSDITAVARHIAIDGSLDLIRTGDHREAVFWMVVTFARCHTILQADAPRELREEHLPAFLGLLSDLGMHSSDDLRERAGAVLDFLPRLGKAAAEVIIATQ